MIRCEAKRRQWRKGRLGDYKCGNKAVWIVTTQVGMSVRHHVCNEDACYAYVTKGYPAQVTAMTK